MADVFDALTSARPYKPAWPMSRAIALLRDGRGRHFDGDCVDALLHAWEAVLEIRVRFRDDDADFRDDDELGIPSSPESPH